MQQRMRGMLLSGRQGPESQAQATPQLGSPSPLGGRVAPSPAAPQAFRGTQVPQLGAPAPSARGSRWQNVLGLALATVADAMAARAGRRGQAVAGLRGQIAGREERDRDRAQQKVLREYRNKMQQFQFEQEGVRRRFAKEEKMEERAYRKGEKESEFQRMLKLAGGGGAAEVSPEKRVRNRLDFRQELDDTSLADLTTSGSQELVDIFNNAEVYGISRDTAEAELKEAIARKRAGIERGRQRKGEWWRRRTELFPGGIRN